MINPLCIKLFSGKQIARTWVEIVFSVNIAVNYFSGFTLLANVSSVGTELRD